MNKCWLYDRCNHKDCDKACLRKYKLETLYKNSLLSLVQRNHIKLRIDDDGTDLEEFQALSKLENNIIEFVNNGTNLFISSANCGNGKTSWAIRFIQTYFDKIWVTSELTCRALFISVPRFLIALKDNISKKSDYVEFIKDNIMSADLVVWDDLGAKVGTEYEINQLLSLIDGRIALGKSNIYTSNLNAQELSIALGERLASRVCNLSITIELHGSDKRFLAVGGNN